MGSITVCCPVATCLENVVTTLNPCSADVGQIQKLVFWRLGNSIASVATAIIQTTWDVLLVATGDTKAVVTPFVHNPDIPAGDPREYGGGNETRWGAPQRKGGQSPALTFTMLAEDQDTIVLLKALRCENLEVLFINEANQLIYSDIDYAGSSLVAGFPVVPNSLFVGDKKIGGFDETDSNILQFNLQPNWSDTLEITAATDFLLSMVNA